MKSAEPSYLELRGAVDLVLRAKYRLWTTTRILDMRYALSTDEAGEILHSAYLRLLKDMHAAGGTRSDYLDFLGDE